MSAVAKIQYVSDAGGEPTGVIVPIDLWRDVLALQTEGSDEPTFARKPGTHPPAEEVWRSLLSCAGQVAASWQNPRSIVELVDEQRR